ncbi:MAG: desulfoferrodoxin [Clostridiales bacterium 43-6]|nr:MAG: desulfoferrodoxin [Clostridiales bacterium 43-6]
MSIKPDFLKCKHCGNIVGTIKNNGPAIVCCGEPMAELIANTTDAALEKHVPVVERDGTTLKVKVGSVEHPMTEEHLIEWICVMTETTTIRTRLEPGIKPEAIFYGVEGPATVYEYCNLHGLWKADVE